ncbi:hypothetical protein FB451DRAFT_282815 [Mycena latifolia]|nr:hypothetical protein FB451DRAFT_282815 [Mycena latifolia]
MIPLGDVDLRYEIHGIGVVSAYRRQGYSRRIYCARIDGRKSNMTVALYQGQAAEEVWRRELDTYSRFRHSNVAQLYAAAASGNIYATIFHDELIPIPERLGLYQHSPMSVVYLLGNLAADAYEAQDYFYEETGQTLELESMLWVRSSTGRLCAEPASNGGNYSALLLNAVAEGRQVLRTGPTRTMPPLDPDHEGTIVSALTLSQYHSLCALFMAQVEPRTIPVHTTVQLGAIMRWPAGAYRLEDMVEVGALVECALDDSGWKMASTSAAGSVRSVRMENGWTRFKSKRMTANTTVLRDLRCSQDSWLAQANYIFARLNVTVNYEDYVLITSASYSICFSGTQNVPIPAGYLFMCPLQDLQSPTTGRFRRPAVPAYWALDSAGAERLAPEDAERRGFPPLRLSTHAWEASWDANVYAGLRQFHAGKGFAPDRQDVARELGVPLYRLSGDGDREAEALFAHVEDETHIEDVDIGDGADSLSSTPALQSTSSRPKSPKTFKPRRLCPFARGDTGYALRLWLMLGGLGILLALIVPWKRF